jgi:hypothetical protein
MEPGLTGKHHRLGAHGVVAAVLPEPVEPGDRGGGSLTSGFTVREGRVAH